MDHERVNVRSTSMSCGVMELSRISDDTDGVLYNLATRLYHPSRGDPCACFVFSDIFQCDIVEAVNNNSNLLTTAVRKREFGTVSTSPPAENPRTGNFIVVYTWVINHENFKKWYAEERVRRLKKVGAR